MKIGVYPQTMNFYVHIEGEYIYDQYGSLKSISTPITVTQTVNNPSVGESAAYYFTINNFDDFIDISGDAFMAGTSLTVTATRGISLSVSINLSNE